MSVGPDRLQKAIGDAAERYVDLCQRRSGWIVLGCALVTALALWCARQVDIDPRIEALMPADTPSQRALEQLEKRAPRGAEPYYLLVESSDLELNQRLTRRLMQEMLKWPETRWAMRKRDPQYFLDRRLLYLGTADLRELADRVEEIVDWERCQRMPGCMNLDDRPADPDLEELRERYQANPETRALISLFGMANLEEAGERKREQREENRPGEQGEPAKRESGVLCSPDGRICAVQASLDGSPNDIEYATRMKDRGEALIRSLWPKNAPADLKMAVSGRYRNAPEIKRSAVSDLRRTTALSLLLVFALVILQFRGPRAFLLLILPVAAGVSWTLGIIGIFHPTLNLISAFTLAVLAGLGIDFGVHMVTYYGAQRQRGSSCRDAMAHTLGSLGISMVAAGATTGCGFAALVAARFRGFSEMGALAGMGVVLALLSFLLLLPALVLLLDRFFAEKRPLTRGWPLPSRGPSGRPALYLALIGILLAAVLGARGRGVEFEYNFRNLRAKGSGTGINWGRTMHGTNRNAIYLMAEDPETLAVTAAAIRREGPRGLLKKESAWVFTPRSFIPPDQPARLKQIARIRRAVEEGERHAGEAFSKRLGRFRRLIEVTEPIRLEEMPRWVTDWLVERNGRFGTMAVLYTDLSGADARKMQFVSERMQKWRERYPEVLFASPVVQLGEVVPGLKNDAPVIVSLALLGLGLGTVLIGRSFGRTLLVLSPVATAVAWSLGLMAMLDLKINMYNMLIFPLAFGIGVDGAIYLVWAALGEEPENGDAAPDDSSAPVPWKRVWTSGRAVIGSTLTTVAAFGSMSISQNPGLASLGKLAILTLLLTLAANLLWLPSVLGWLKSRGTAGGLD